MPPCESDVVGCVTACQGPPKCNLEGDEAEKAIKDGCVWCIRIYVYSDNSETIVEPNNELH